MATRQSQIKVEVQSDTTKFDIDPAKKSLRDLQRESAGAKAELARLQLEFQQSKNAAVQAGTAYDKVVGNEFKKKISEARTEISRLNAEVAQGVAKGVGNANITGNVGGFASSLTSLITPMAAVGAAYTALNQAFRISNLADSLGDISDATGNTVGSLRTLQTSLVAAGGSVADMDKIASRFAISVGEAAEGNEKVIDTFKRLKVPIKEANGEMRSQDAILQDAIKALAGIENPAQRAAIAVDLFGKSAAKLDFSKLSAVRDFETEESVKNLNNLRSEMEKLGAYIDNVLIGFFGRLAKSINEAFPSNTAARVERLTKAITDMEARASKNGGLGFGDTKSLELWKKQLSEATDVVNKADEARLRASAGPRGGTGEAYKPTAVKDSQFGTPKEKEKEVKLRADLANKESEQQKQSLNEFKFISDEYKRLYDQNLINIRDYYAQQEALIQKQRADDNAAFLARQEQLAAEKTRLEKGGADKAEVLKVEEALQKAITENQSKQLGYVTQLKTLQDGQAAAAKKFSTELAAINLQYLEIQGLGASQEAQQLRINAIAKQYEEQLKRIRAEKGDGSAEEAQVVAIQKQLAATQELAAAQNALKQSQTQNTVDQLNIQQQLNAGLISQVEAQARINDLKAKAIEQEIAQQEIAKNSPGLSTNQINDATIKIAELKAALASVQPQLVSFGTQFQNLFQDRIGGALADVLTKTRSFKDAFKSLLAGIVQDIIRSNINKALAGLFSAGFGGGFTNDAGGREVAGSLGFAEGGYIRGPGSGTSDSIPARLSNGEFVIKAASVNKFGKGFFDMLNSGEMPAFAKGGLVARQPRVVPGFATGGQVSVSSNDVTVNVINNSSQPVRARQEQDPKSGVIQVILEDLQRGGPISRNINAVTGTGRAVAR